MQQVPGDPAHDHLAGPGVAVTADNQKISLDVGGIVEERIGWRQPVGHHRPRR